MQSAKPKLAHTHTQNNLPFTATFPMKWDKTTNNEGIENALKDFEFRPTNEWENLLEMCNKELQSILGKAKINDKNVKDGNKLELRETKMAKRNE